jgi:hypothetical protein
LKIGLRERERVIQERVRIRAYVNLKFNKCKGFDKVTGEENRPRETKTKAKRAERDTILFSAQSKLRTSRISRGNLNVKMDLELSDILNSLLSI